MVLFWGHQPSQDGAIKKTCFSQWFEAEFEVDGIRYPTAEHFMMAGKARLFGDEKALARIMQARNPGAAKAAGRKVQGFDEPTWEAHRWEIVVAANVAKFSQNPPLRDFLLATGDQVLVEASPVDRIWGTGVAADSPHAGNPARWTGLNLLGFALMEARSRIRERGGVR
ncbi:NADAR family protein [Pseudoduganella violaceinigra]|uniref:NADAR family protein n=1 Tax=Pseudoduganella violaceinigra TaxID=246602 RepID=UPI00042293B9